MGGVRDHPREAGGVEVAFLEVELPGPDLLGEQAALEPVGELADDALQVRELLVEVRAQPAQLVRLAELRRVDGFVVVRAIGVVLVAVGEVAPRLGAPDRLARGLGVLVAELQAAGVEAVRVPGVGLVLAGALAHLGAFHALGSRVVGIAGLALVQRARVAVALGLVVVRFVPLRVGLLVGEPEGAQQLAHRPRIGPLIARATGQLGEVRADHAFELRPPVLQHLHRRGRRKLAEHGLAREQSEHLGERRPFGVAEAVEAQGFDPRVERGVEVDGDPGHRPRAERLAPRLFQDVEHLAGLGAARRVPGVERRVVVAQLQRRRIGLAAGAYHLLVRQRRIRARDPHRPPRRAGALGHELDVQLPGAPDRPRRRRGGAAERVEGPVGPGRAVSGERRHRVCRAAVRLRSGWPARRSPAARRRSSAGSTRRRSGARPRRTC